MLDVLIYFENIPTARRTLFLVTGLSFFLLIESLAPLFRYNYHKGKHAAINITFTLITLVINLFGATLIVTTVNFTNKNQFVGNRLEVRQKTTYESLKLANKIISQM